VISAHAGVTPMIRWSSRILASWYVHLRVTGGSKYRLAAMTLSPS
jgi:hypothetical protein